MKIVIVNSTDMEGGAARAAYRLHRALLSENADSTMLVQLKKGDDFSVLGPSSKIREAIALMRPKLDLLSVYPYRKKEKILFSSSWLPGSGLVTRINSMSPDLVHLHWVCGGALTIEDIARIKAPIVWSLHDNWLFTGGCHIMWDCKKYMTGCGKCPVLKSGKERDLSSRVFVRKSRVFKKKRDITISGLSSWITERAEESILLKDYRKVTLPNPVDTDLFKPIDKAAARNILGIPGGVQIILFGAMNSTSDVNKGFPALLSALRFLEPKDINLIIFGSGTPKEPPAFGFPVRYFGRLQDDYSLMLLYNAADVTVVPSRQENLSNVILESLACGTPVVAFNVGGNRDMVRHQVNGYLAEELSSKDLAMGIDWILANRMTLSLGEKARETVIKNFANSLVAKSYLRLYKELL